MILSALLVLLICSQPVTWQLVDPPPITAEIVATTSAGDLDDVPLLLLLSEIGSRGFDLVMVNRARATWAPPESGLAPVYYVVEYEAQAFGQDHYSIARYVLSEQFDVALLAGLERIRGRVAGVDQLGRIGEWTTWTDWHLITED